MGGQDIIVVGASAGGVEALSTLVADLPDDLPAAVFIVLHMGPHSSTALPRILARRTTLPVDHPRDGETIEPNRIYVAVPDRHLLLAGGTVRVARGPKENGHRPSVDTLFRTAAAGYGPRVVGVVLSGTRDDGTAGLRAIHDRGGVSVVQDPDETLFPGMPQSALTGDHPDYVLPVGEMGAPLSKLARNEVSREGRSAAMADELDTELRWANPELAWAAPADPPLGSPSGFTCPECHGGLWEIDDEGLPVTGAGWATASPPRACSSASRPTSRRRCGSPTGLWRSGRRCSAGWPTGPRGAGPGSPPSTSGPRRPR